MMNILSPNLFFFGLFSFPIARFDVDVPGGMVYKESSFTEAGTKSMSNEYSIMDYVATPVHCCSSRNHVEYTIRTSSFLHHN